MLGLKTRKKKHYIHCLSLELYKVSIFNLFGRLNTCCRIQVFHVTIFFFYVKFYKLRFFSVFRSINGILHKSSFTSITYTIWIINFSTFSSVFRSINGVLHKPPFTSIRYQIWIINFSTFLRVLQYFYVKSIFPWKIKVCFYIQKWVFQ